MILSFHPIFEGDTNITCAGREPDSNDLLSIKAANAVILPQGCKKPLYEMARNNCLNFFPNYDARFEYEDKLGQIKLFRKLKVSHPDTQLFETLDAFYKSCGRLSDYTTFKYPFVFKFNWGGEGDNVFLVQSAEEFNHILQKVMKFEKTGQKGFLIQAFIPFQNRTLRVVIINREIRSYWRVQKDTETFHVNLSKGADIDFDSDPLLQEKAVLLTKNFSEKTGVNLAGFDFLFSPETAEPLFLEINYFFGRRGLGGSEEYYRLIVDQIYQWLSEQGLAVGGAQ